MSRSLRRAALAAAVAVAVLAPGAAASAHPTVAPRSSRVAGPCALSRTAGESIQSFSKRLIQCAADRWAVPGGAAKAICIAKRESGLVPTAKSAGGKYLGLFQHAKAYWPANFDAYTRHVWRLDTRALNGRSNAVVTIRMAHDPAVGWRPWAGAGC